MESSYGNLKSKQQRLKIQFINNKFFTSIYKRLSPDGSNYDKIRITGKLKKKKPIENETALLTNKLKVHKANIKEDKDIKQEDASQLCDYKMHQVNKDRSIYEKPFLQPQEYRSDLDSIPLRVKQSRRDVVKILCKKSSLTCCI